LKPTKLHQLGTLIATLIIVGVCLVMAWAGTGVIGGAVGWTLGLLAIGSGIAWAAGWIRVSRGPRG